MVGGDIWASGRAGKSGLKTVVAAGGRLGVHLRSTARRAQQVSENKKQGGGQGLGSKDCSLHVPAI